MEIIHTGIPNAKLRYFVQDSFFTPHQICFIGNTIAECEAYIVDFNKTLKEFGATEDSKTMYILAVK